MSLTEQEKLGVMLFHKRNQLGLRQADVAKRIHMQTPTISTYECGVVKNITLATLLRALKLRRFLACRWKKFCMTAKKTV